MLIYIFVAIWPLLVGYYYDSRIGVYLSAGQELTKAQRKQRRNWLLIAAIPMFLLIALRSSNMGADTATYLKFFRLTAASSWEHMFDIVDFEPGYVVFEKLVSYISREPLFFQIVYSTIFLIEVVHFANQLEKSNFLFLYFFATLGIYTFMFTGVRQCLAMCICLFSYGFIKKRRLLPFLLCVLLAFQFHKSSVLFVAAYFIYNRKLNMGNVLLYLVFAAIFYINIEVIQEWFNEQLEYDYGVEETGSGFIYLAVVTLITVFSFVMMKLFHGDSPEYTGLLNVGIIAWILWVLRLQTRVAERPSYYFLFFSMAMLGYGIDAIKDRREKSLACLATIGFAMLLYVYRLATNFSSMVPYVPFF